VVSLQGTRIKLVAEGSAPNQINTDLGD